MNIRSRLSAIIAGAVAALALAATPALAGTQPLTGWISYAAKFVCGVQDGVPAEQPVVNGKYRTVINIHNPHYLFSAFAPGTLPVQFAKKVVLALPQGEIPIAPSCHLFETLDNDHALAVDCKNIRAQLTLAGIVVPNPFEGFLVIEVAMQHGLNETPQLDVTAVYTARHRPGVGADAADYDVQAIEVETVEPSRILGDPVQVPCG